LLEPVLTRAILKPCIDKGLARTCPEVKWVWLRGAWVGFVSPDVSVKGLVRICIENDKEEGKEEVCGMWGAVGTTRPTTV
jgi:hypothetical protein